MRDDVTPPPTRLRGGPPAGPRSAGLAVVLPPPAAAVVDLDARRARSAVVDLATAERGPRSARPEDALVAAVPAAPVVRARLDESALSIQDRVRLRALEAARA
ncbi:hypothetical protein FHN55_08455 [Streptomyces sp. NP160]|uniref:hypothetical protein n=1 Tax=Streptomyces sp. NP160 TaxID=2586637 RepID=UPI0011183C3D|nr:hypothetical protein [Streptomyces sp. NP160]TNM68042.1 hypothetical protein FHN55_08455 [Streptomyces sp. NP160]